MGCPEDGWSFHVNCFGRNLVLDATQSFLLYTDMREPRPSRVHWRPSNTIPWYNQGKGYKQGSNLWAKVTPPIRETDHPSLTKAKKPADPSLGRLNMSVLFWKYWIIIMPRPSKRCQFCLDVPFIKRRLFRLNPRKLVFDRSIWAIWLARVMVLVVFRNSLKIHGQKSAESSGNLRKTKHKLEELVL